MARPLRICFPGAFYHITSRGNERKDIYKSNRDREKFLEYLESAVVRYKGVIHVYCLMSNHYHLLLETPSGNLSQIMRHINGAYTNYFNTKRKRSGHLFQGRYKAILVEMDKYAQELSRYIHLNPVRANMVETPETYRWSSYRYYAGLMKPPEWLKIDFILGYFGNTVAVAQKKYQQFVGQLKTREYQSPLKDVVGSTLLGSPDFINHIKKAYLTDKPADKEIPAMSALADDIAISDIMNQVENEFCDGGSLARDVKIFLLKKYTRTRLKDIGILFGIVESGVSKVTTRFWNKLETDEALKKRIHKIEERLSRVKI